jgi:hypothetical protein
MLYPATLLCRPAQHALVHVEVLVQLSGNFAQIAPIVYIEPKIRLKLVKIVVSKAKMS